MPACSLQQAVSDFAFTGDGQDHPLDTNTRFMKARKYLRTSDIAKRVGVHPNTVRLFMKIGDTCRRYHAAEVVIASSLKTISPR